MKKISDGPHRRIALAATVIGMALAMAACGNAGESSAPGATAKRLPQVYQWDGVIRTEWRHKWSTLGDHGEENWSGEFHVRLLQVPDEWHHSGVRADGTHVMNYLDNLFPLEIVYAIAGDLNDVVE